MSNYIGTDWKDIAKGHTAFCILGGPSVKEVQDLDNIVKNNFTITVNHNIKLYPNVDLFLTADNSIAREYLEDKKFFLHRFKGGKLLKAAANFTYELEPIWVDGKRHTISQNENLIKVVACNNFPSYNFGMTTGQLYKHHGEEYCKVIKNLHLCIEHRNEEGDSWPVLSPELIKTVEEYGTNPLNLYPGGNIAGTLFQLLYYMNFDKVIVVGYGDKGESAGYSPGTQFEWSSEEIHAIVVHNMKWGSRLKSLHGSELCREYVEFNTASYSELETTPDKKNELVNKLLQL